MTAAEPRELRCAASLSIPTPELYPSVTHTSLLQCFDVATRSLRNYGDSDPAGIVSVVRWTSATRWRSPPSSARWATTCRRGFGLNYLNERITPGLPGPAQA